MFFERSFDLLEEGSIQDNVSFGVDENVSRYTCQLKRLGDHRLEQIFCDTMIPWHRPFLPKCTYIVG